MTDAFEAVIAKKLSLSLTGLKLNSPLKENHVMKAYDILSQHYTIPPLEMHLKKAIPPEAGLGGGSADAAFALKLINTICNLDLSDNTLEKMAESIGADCPFFIRNTPVLATGKGVVFTPIDLSLRGYMLCVIIPPVKISTKEMYGMIKPQKPNFQLEKLPSLKVSGWKDVLVNDFEPVACSKYPVIGKIKEQLYSLGAEYAAMSGSGSAVFGIFDKPVSLDFPKCFVWKSNIL
jgi:4-diphosphocytidyl-2-C-methyl-D-erythritol kinase